ncbi:NAD(P)-dependent oxidoreductase [Pelagicoccus sp. SDUM812002]|uniref:NAD-dependent epimerase/dehydratase family protein n=1 Tax=Pelagicoccus sp. SDUM812002 TaxID=3041266 RepID=UPI00280F8511|nr:NAD(P)-dependent oxidoreductase [Pelagicoccus sp. SDUM812002]MDQ8187863.1 NAD(P)-dependent oxidoreductase [Pelagicoccus sp. SDUM812002]
MKHLIFGGDGFLGKELTKKLISKGEKVVIFDLKKTEEAAIYKSDLVTHIEMDVTKTEDFALVDIQPDDVPYHFAARLLVPILPRGERKEYFWTALYEGTKNVLSFLERNNCKRMIYYTTDMVYGHTVHHPRFEDHPRAPLGPYGDAKLETEYLCEEYRKKGFNITIFRPRLIIGPGRLGILEKLFKLVDANLPVPTIGSGKNYYQFISVSDCANAVICAVENGIPNEAYNLGSLNPPTVNELLKKLINHANSKSFLIPTPAGLVKFTLDLFDRVGKPIMDPEQYLIADETCVLDVSKGERDLGWIPQDTDEDMLIAAYKTYREGLEQK